MSVVIEKENIVRAATDAIVNAANEGLFAGGGVCGAIFRAAGEAELTKACRAIGHCDTGSAVITPGFLLPAKYIIHAVGPVWEGGGAGERELLTSCYTKSLALAKDYHLHSITFPLISAGIFGVPLDVAWECAIEGTKDTDLEVHFAVLDDRILEAGRRIQREHA